jgi:hypothetical protein
MQTYSPFFFFFFFFSSFSSFLLFLFSLIAIIARSTETILELRLSLRTSGHLLLGLARLYNLKVVYLLEDSKEAMSNLQNSVIFIDLAQPVVSENTITLTEYQYPQLTFADYAQLQLSDSQPPSEDDGVEVGQFRQQAEQSFTPSKRNQSSHQLHEVDTFVEQEDAGLDFEAADYPYDDGMEPQHASLDAGQPYSPDAAGETAHASLNPLHDFSLPLMSPLSGSGIHAPLTDLSVLAEEAASPLPTESPLTQGPAKRPKKRTTEPRAPANQTAVIKKQTWENWLRNPKQTLRDFEPVDQPAAKRPSIGALRQNLPAFNILKDLLDNAAATGPSSSSSLVLSPVNVETHRNAQPVEDSDDQQGMDTHATYDDNNFDSEGFQPHHESYDLGAELLSGPATLMGDQYDALPAVDTHFEAEPIAESDHGPNPDEFSTSDRSASEVSTTSTDNQTLSADARALYHYLKSAQSTVQSPLSFREIVQNSRRRTVAKTFYELLCLKSYSLIDVEQQRPNGEILLTVIDDAAQN